jgi:hypothetical protein
MKVEKVAILVNSSPDSWEGLRSTLGLLVENLWVAAFFIDTEVQLPASKSEEEFRDNLLLLEDLEGELYTNLQSEVDKWGTFEYLSLEDMVAKIKDYELVVPFGG